MAHVVEILPDVSWSYIDNTTVADVWGFIILGDHSQ